ncbi:NAD-dependent epimerase/dehydratase family protein [Solicola sp. PLA-1-18]|uniref:NAD-dependent epimerase/dehydratase family protein n=1 Tax=Solicola sp. PLA-1-18 TaxID=3380532 RepID=UPI003B77272E
MTTVVLTGGAGRLGRAAVRDLVEHGHDVVVLDHARPDLPDEVMDAVTYLPIDLGEYGDVLDAMLGVQERFDRVDAVVHLAAIPAPGLAPDHRTFENNMNATFNVFSAARRAGVQKIVWASSETVLGLPFDTPPPYVPVDEEYHPRPESTYSLTKTLEEELALQLCRWDPGLSMTGLRFSNVMYPEDYAEFPSFDADPMLRKWNLWGYIDARDGAQAIRLGLEHTEPGREVFVIANADTVMSRSSAELVAEVFPGVEVRGELGEHETLLSIDKARRVLGFDPQHSWRDHV